MAKARSTIQCQLTGTLRSELEHTATDSYIGRGKVRYPDIMTGSNVQQPASRRWQAFVGNEQFAAYHQGID